MSKRFLQTLAVAYTMSHIVIWTSQVGAQPLPEWECYDEEWEWIRHNTHHADPNCNTDAEHTFYGICSDFITPDPTRINIATCKYCPTCERNYEIWNATRMTNFNYLQLQATGRFGLFDPNGLTYGPYHKDWMEICEQTLQQHIQHADLLMKYPSWFCPRGHTRLSKKEEAQYRNMNNDTKAKFLQKICGRCHEAGKYIAQYPSST